MKFTTARLCGGEALMAISVDLLDLNMEKARDFYKAEGNVIKQFDSMMLVFEWKDMEVTVYPAGKVMFFPLKDKKLCIEYATEILEHIKD
jgi:hypothetical protein